MPLQSLRADRRPAERGGWLMLSEWRTTRDPSWLPTQSMIGTLRWLPNVSSTTDSSRSTTSADSSESPILIPPSIGGRSWLSRS